MITSGAVVTLASFSFPQWISKYHVPKLNKMPCCYYKAFIQSFSKSSILVQNLLRHVNPKSLHAIYQQTIDQNSYWKSFCVIRVF